MSSFTKVEKRDSISYEEFIEEHLKKRIPVVFKNATSAWKSNKIFTPEFFSEKFGTHKTTLEGQEYTMDQILDLTRKGTKENPAPYPILFEIPTQIPELLDLFQPIDLKYAKPNWFKSDILPYGKFGKSVHLFIGGIGNQYSLHRDYFHTNAWITQLYGQKKFIVFPEEQSEFLYAGKEGFSRFLSPINVLNPDYEKYPQYKKSTPLEIILEPGETIFVPNGVWHTTVGMGHNISLMVDQLNGYNFKAWKKDVFEIKKLESKLKANMHYAYANFAGALCKAAELAGNKF